jgi:hypothetical protein
MNQPKPEGRKDDNRPKADHGAPTEVSWDDGAGRQPYANQGDREAGEPNEGEFAEGDRGELSGRNLEQLEQVKGKSGSDDVKQHQQDDDDQRNAE